LTATGDVLLSASGNFITDNTARKTIVSNGGNVSILADSDATGTGRLDLDRLTVNAGSGNILIRGETMSWATDSAEIIPILIGTGALTIEPSDQSFGQDTDFTSWIKLDEAGASFTSVTLGKPTNTANMSLGVNAAATAAVSVNGPIIVRQRCICSPRAGINCC